MSGNLIWEVGGSLASVLWAHAHLGGALTWKGQRWSQVSRSRAWDRDSCSFRTRRAKGKKAKPGHGISRRAAA